MIYLVGQLTNMRLAHYLNTLQTHLIVVRLMSWLLAGTQNSSIKHPESAILLLRTFTLNLNPVGSCRGESELTQTRPDGGQAVRSVINFTS